MKKIASLLLLLLLPLIGFAGEVSVNPAVIDRTAQVRDNFSLQIRVENKTDSNFRFYPVVTDFSRDDGALFENGENGLSDWVSINRGRFDLSPNEEEIIDFSINVDSNAEPGVYYGKLFFSQGSTAQDARNAAKDEKQPEVIIRLEVVEGIVENAQLRFESDRDIYLTSSFNFNAEIDNIGNREIKPRGEILIYNERTGREVKTIPFNEGEEAIEAESSQVIKNSWKGSGFGRYRAVLRAEYGEETTRDLQSTVYFWILPLPFVFGFLGFIAILFISLIILLKKMMNA